jgi:hypothetical protein
MIEEISPKKQREIEQRNEGKQKTQRRKVLKDRKSVFAWFGRDDNINGLLI